MEVFLLLVLIILVVLSWVITSDKINRLEGRIKELTNRVKDIYVAQVNQEVKKEPAKQTPAIEAPPKPVSEVKPPIVPVTPVVPVIKPKIVEEKKQEEKPPVVTPVHYEPIPQVKPKPVIPPKPPKPSFFERNPDLEKFIGENLINKIGIAVLVLGIGFFVKYAIDQNWINEYGRVAIGLLCGGILLGIAHYLRKRFKAFSSVLVGGGISVLYFTIAIAFHQYHIFDQAVAFIIMVVITAFAVFLSLAYDRIELAVISVIGGFATPFMVSTGEGNYIVLFTYLMILNVGMLVMAYFKKWNLINILSYAFTVLIYGGWLISKLGDSDSPYMGALIFGSLFYFVFFLMNVVNNIKEKRIFASLDFILLISNTALYYAAGMYIMHNIQHGDFEGLFTAVLAVFNFVFAFVLYKRQGIDRNLVFLLIGLVLSFVSLAAPVQLQGHYITLFWSAETVLLLWLSQKSGIKLMKLASIIVMCLMFISLLMDWSHVYKLVLIGDNTLKPLDIVFNKGFITGVVSVISIFLAAVFLKKETEKTLYGWLDLNGYRIVLNIIGVIVLYLTMLLELSFQLDTRMGYEPACYIIIGFYNLLFLTGLHIYVMRQKSFVLSNILLIVSALALIIYIFFYNYQIVLTRNDFLVGTHATLFNYMFHYLTMLSALGLLVITFIHAKRTYTLTSDIGIMLLWFTSIIAVYIASAELTHATVMISYKVSSSVSGFVDQSVKIGYPILWGICSFILMILGMRLKMRHLRIISLSLFFITLVKLCVYDIRDVSEGGKIAAFISLGIILLVVSFMYQKLKVLILSDEGDKQKPGKNE